MIRELRLTLRQVGYELRNFVRNPAAAGFTFVFPLMFLLIFGAVYGDGNVDTPHGQVRGIQFQMAQIMVFAVVGSTYVSLVTTLALRRDSGELKRKRGTPVSPFVVLGGVMGNGVLLALAMSVAVVALSALLFGASIALERIPSLAVVLAVGALAFCALGAAVAALVPNGDAASPIANLTIFPLYFLSGVFIPEVPEALAQIADVLPLRPFLLALSQLFDPGGGAGIDAGRLAVVAAWGIGATLVAMRFFRWSPRH